MGSNGSSVKEHPMAAEMRLFYFLLHIFPY
jgi:hypothetical protein